MTKPIPQPKVKTCIECGSDFSKEDNEPNRRYSQRQTCSDECRKIRMNRKTENWHAKRIEQENSPFDEFGKLKGATMAQLNKTFKQAMNGRLYG